MYRVFLAILFSFFFKKSESMIKQKTKIAKSTRVEDYQIFKIAELEHH